MPEESDDRGAIAAAARALQRRSRARDLGWQALLAGLRLLLHPLSPDGLRAGAGRLARLSLLLPTLRLSLLVAALRLFLCRYSPRSLLALAGLDALRSRDLGGAGQGRRVAVDEPLARGDAGDTACHARGPDQWLPLCCLVAVPVGVPDQDHRHNHQRDHEEHRKEHATLHRHASLEVAGAIKLALPPASSHGA